MRRFQKILPILLITAAFPALAAQPEPAAPPTHTVQALRPGKGQPRVRNTSMARPASPRKLGQAEGTGRTRPYQAPKPGEGEPKG